MAGIGILNLGNIAPPNNFLTNRNLAAILATLDRFFDGGPTAVCLDVTSMTLDRPLFIIVLHNLLDLSRARKIPFFLLPYNQVKKWWDFGEVSLVNTLTNISLLLVDWAGQPCWIGEASRHNDILNTIWTDGYVEVNRVAANFGHSLEWMEKESKRDGGYLSLSDGRYTLRLSRQEIDSFLTENKLLGTRKALCEHDVVMRYGHYVIQYDLGQPELHTDTLLAVARLIESTNGIDKSLRLTAAGLKTRGITDYNGLVVSNRLVAILPSMCEHVEVDHAHAITEQQLMDGHTLHHILPDRSKVLVIDSFARTGANLMRLTDLATPMYDVVACAALFGVSGTPPVVAGKPTVIGYPIEIGQWTGEANCPLCALGLERQIVGYGGEEAAVQENRHLAEATPYHFWSLALRTHAAVDNRVSHLADSAEHHFDLFLRLDSLLSDTRARDTISSHIYTLLVSSVEQVQRITAFVYKEGMAARLLAEALAELHQGSPDLISVDASQIRKMAGRPADYGRELLDLADKLRGHGVVLVDDGINRGTTLGNFLRFFKDMSINHLATTVVIDRSTLGLVPRIDASPIISFYHPYVPTWQASVPGDCPWCSLLEYLAKCPHNSVVTSETFQMFLNAWEEDIKLHHIEGNE